MTCLHKERDIAVIRFGTGTSSVIIISYYQDQEIIAANCLDRLGNIISNYGEQKMIIGGDWNATKRNWRSNTSTPGGELHSRGTALDLFAKREGFSIYQPTAPTRINHCLDFFLTKGLSINAIHLRDVVQTDHKLVAKACCPVVRTTYPAVAHGAAH